MKFSFFCYFKFVAIFEKNNVNILPKKNLYDHEIKTKSNNNLLYNLIYNFFVIKFEILRKYINKNFKKKIHKTI